MPEVLAGAALAIAAFERTVLANRAPFQQWLRGDESALSAQELRGGILFFGEAGCVQCHRGPALSSEQGATEDQMFFAVGFSDLDTSDSRIHGNIAEADRRGRGGFTTRPQDNFKFKIPPLYNLADNDFMGHGASFQTIRSVVEYKNRAAAQNAAASDSLDSRFQPLGLTTEEITDLVAFLENALRDPELMRYQPDSVPSGHCLVVDPLTEIASHLCP